MGKKKSKKNPHKHSLPQLVVTQRLERKRSGAAGVHADQKTRALGLALTNRVGSRSSITVAAVKDSLRSNSRGESFLSKILLLNYCVKDSIGVTTTIKSDENHRKKGV